MAPKEPYKVHSLSKHVEDTKKGLSGAAQYNRRPISKAAAAGVKNEPLDAAVFGNNNDSDESSDTSDTSDSDSDSDGGAGAGLMKKLGANGAKPSTGPKRRVKVEEIADSDIERTASAKRAAAAKQGQLAKKESSSSDSSSDSSSESEPEQSEPKAKTNGAVSTPQAAAVEQSSSSSSEDESDEAEEESDDEEDPKAEPKSAVKQSATPATPVATNGTAKVAAAAADSSSSSEEESSDDEAEPAKPQPAKAQSTKAQSTKAQPTKATPARAQPAKEATEESSSDSQDSDARVDESMELSDREMDTQLATPNFIAPDFTLRKGDDGANGQDVARICNEANLQGKQFWYFTVPSNVPVSVIENIEIPMEGSQLGSRVFSHDGQDYGVSFDTISTRSSIQILIPSSSDSNYQPARQQVAQTMHIKRIANLGGAAATTVGPAPRRAARPQPKGLKARYQPFGVNTPMGTMGADASGDEDVEMEEAPAAVATPKPAKKDKKSKKDDAKQSQSKDKKTDADVAATPKAAAPKAAAPKAAEVKTPKTDRKGKRKHTISEDDALAAEAQLKEDTQSAKGMSKKQKMARASSPELGAELPPMPKKQTPIAPPTIPSSSYSFSNLTSSATAAAATPSKVAAATPSTAKKSAKKTKPETPVPAARQTAVPLPSIPLTARPKESPVPLPPSAAFATPVQSKSKKSKAIKDEVNATGSSQQSPPPSAQGGDKKKAAIKAKGSG
ncbi:DNA-directed RNA polymerase I subunit [Trichoderma novae-zelandiae]